MTWLITYHLVHRILQLKHFALSISCDFLAQIALGYSFCYDSNVAYLACNSVCHHVDIVSKVLPRAGYILDNSLAAENSFGSNFQRDTSDFCRKCRKLSNEPLVSIDVEN